MTGLQAALYRAALRIGRAWSVGGATWTYYPPPSANGITAAATLTADGTRTLYVVQEKLSTWGQPLPPQPVGMTQYRLVAPVDTDIAAGAVVVSGAFAFIIGPLDSDQGFPTAIMTKTTAPATVVIPPTGLTGQPMGLLLSLTYAA